MEKLLVYLCLISLLVTLGLCIQCHQCTTLEADSCLDPYGEDNVDDCEDKDTHCVKYKTVIGLHDTGYIDGGTRDSIVVTRSCEKDRGKSDGCYGTVANGGVVVKCICSTDACNSGFKMSNSFTLFIISLLLAVFMYISR